MVATKSPKIYSLGRKEQNNQRKGNTQSLHLASGRARHRALEEALLDRLIPSDSPLVSIPVDPMLLEFNLQPSRWAHLGGTLGVAPCSGSPEMITPAPVDGRSSASAAAGDTARATADLEMVRFEVQGSPQVLHTPGLRNITVARGTRETLPLHLFNDNEIPANEWVVDFAHTMCRNAPSPALAAPHLGGVLALNNKTSLSGVASGWQRSRDTAPRSPPSRRRMS